MQFKDYLCNISHGFKQHSASRGFSATVELLVAFIFDLIQKIGWKPTDGRTRLIALPWYLARETIVCKLGKLKFRPY